MTTREPDPMATGDQNAAAAHALCADLQRCVYRPRVQRVGSVVYGRLPVAPST